MLKDWITVIRVSFLYLVENCKNGNEMNISKH